MEVVNVSATHDLTIFARENVGNATAIVYNEQTKNQESQIVATTYNAGKLTFTLAYQTSEGDNYFVILNNEAGTEELAKFKMYCTDATDLQRYSVSDGQFTEPNTATNSNEFIEPA